jgi:hypothetical protein
MAARDVVAYVCFGDPEPHVGELEELAQTQGQGWWTINRHASGGDIALFYIKRPVSAFVAWGVVQSTPVLRTEEPWEGHYAANVAQVRLLGRQVTRVELCERFPEWRYLNLPRQSVAVPGDLFEPLMACLGISWQDAALVW